MTKFIGRVHKSLGITKQPRERKPPPKMKRKKLDKWKPDAALTPYQKQVKALYLQSDQPEGQQMVLIDPNQLPRMVENEDGTVSLARVGQKADP